MKKVFVWSIGDMLFVIDNFLFLRSGRRNDNAQYYGLQSPKGGDTGCERACSVRRHLERYGNFRLQRVGDALRHLPCPRKDALRCSYGKVFGKISNEKVMLGNGFKIEKGGTLCVNGK